MVIPPLIIQTDEKFVGDTLEVLETIRNCVDLFHKLIDITKIKDEKNILSISMKQGKIFVECFIKISPFIGHHFKDQNALIRRILKSLQKGTRRMQVSFSNYTFFLNQRQTLCTHAKRSKDPLLSNLVPSVRKILETVLFKIKGIMEENSMLKAFVVANLKPRNIHGEEIASDEDRIESSDELNSEDNEEESERKKEKEESDQSEDEKRQVPEEGFESEEL